MMPLFTNGGGLILVLLLITLIPLAVLTVYGWAMRNAPFICELPDPQGFPCGCRYRSRDSYEDHLEVSHDGGPR